MACKKGQFDAVELMVNDQSKTFSINLNAQHVNGMTPFHLALSSVIRYSRVVWPCTFSTQYTIWRSAVAGKKSFVSIRFSLCFGCWSP